MTLTPAYGRDYCTTMAATKDFREGKDFVATKMGQSTYCSVRDLPRGTVVMLRFNKLRDVVMVEA